MGRAIVGREGELAVVRAFLASLSAGPAALVIAGEAGIGKTTIWRAGVDEARARRLRVLVAGPAEAETRLSFAALGDLLEDAFPEVAAGLPAPQRRALEIALLLDEDDPAGEEQRAVGVAVLNVFRVLSRDGPVVLAVDDVQWLDGASARVLSFAARRLREEPIGWLLAERGIADGPDPLGLDRALPPERRGEVRVESLSLGALHRLLHERLGVAFARPVTLRVHELAGGNPFFALEIGRALQQSGFDPSPGEPLPVPRTLHELVRERIVALPNETREALVAAAALSQPTVGLIEAHVGSRAPLQPAIDAHVVTLRAERIAFTHPLLASAAYADVDPARRREVHRRLAGLVDDPEERARHLAIASVEPDAAVAEALEVASKRAHGRGAPASAAELAEQALHLTPAERADDVLRRGIEAAGHHFEAGDPRRARTLLEDAVEAAPAGPRRADALRRLARVHAFGTDQRAAASLYRAALDDAGEGSAVRADAEHGLAVALMRMLEDLPAAARHAQAAARIAEASDDRASLVEFLAVQALIEGLLGRPEATPLMARAAELADDEGVSSRYFVRGLAGPGFMAAVLGAWLDDVEGARARIAGALSRAAELGDESSLPLLLRWASYAEWLAGRWDEALRLADEGYEIAVQTGQPSQRAVLAGTRALVLAHLGRGDEARAAAGEGLLLADETGATFGRVLGVSALGLLDLSLGNAAGAVDELTALGERLEAAGVREPGAMRFVPDEIEALVHLGRLDEAELLLSSHEARAHALGRASAISALGRCRGLLLAARKDVPGALVVLEEALAGHDRVPLHFERARTELAIGATLRRAKKKGAAREHLERSLAVFDELGAMLWAEKARAELERIGGRAPAGDELTLTERRVAELVAGGLQTKQVAHELFVSTKTVEGHLSRIYVKLGVHSRTELARRLLDEPPA